MRGWIVPAALGVLVGAIFAGKIHGVLKFLPSVG